MAIDCAPPRGPQKSCHQLHITQSIIDLHFANGTNMTVYTSNENGKDRHSKCYKINCKMKREGIIELTQYQTISAGHNKTVTPADSLD